MYGCEHYKRCVKLLTPCCNKIYVCHICHNEKEGHVLNKASVRSLICFRCNTKQELRTTCRYCEVQFGEYSCLKCRLFDTDKQQYHCRDCGLCRVGPKAAFYHCSKCNLCLNNVLRNQHKCIENVSRDNCSICTEELHTSRDKLELLQCGHFLHENCYKQLVEKKQKTCPVCIQDLQINSVIGKLNSGGVTTF